MATKKSARPGKTRTPARKTPARKSASKGAQAGTAAAGSPSWRSTWPRIVARAWSDPQFLARLKREPKAVFKEYNLPLIPDFEYEVRSGGDSPLVTLSVPRKPGRAGKERVADITADDERAPPKSCTNTCTF